MLYIIFSLSVLTKSISIFNNSLDHNSFFSSKKSFDDQGSFEYSWINNQHAWQIGTGTNFKANAIVGGQENCPTRIDIPRSFDNGSLTAPVETIGIYAFSYCGIDSNSTKIVFITKQVKVIKEYAFSNENYFTNFSFEAGSELETIESYGMSQIGLDIKQEKYTLVLPRTLTSVSVNGIYHCDLFRYIVFCGVNDLAINNSELISNKSQIVLRVVDEYRSKKVLGQIFQKDIGTKIDCAIPPTPIPTVERKQLCSKERSQSALASLFAFAFFIIPSVKVKQIIPHMSLIIWK